MYNNPLEFIARYWKGLHAEMGTTYIVWIIFTGSLIGIGLTWHIWPMVIVGALVWILGGCAFAIEVKRKHKG